MRSRKILFSLVGIIFLLVLYVLYSNFYSPNDDQLKDQLSKKKELTVIIRNSPSVYYQGINGPSGFEYDLVKALADSLGMKLNLKVCYTVSDVLKSINKGEGDLGSSAITITNERKKEFVFSSPYQSVQELVIYKRGNDYPKDLTDLSNFQILVSKGSSYDQKLKVLKKKIPDLTWQTTDSLSTEQILEKVWKGEVECTVADNNLFVINQRYFPGLKSAIPISNEQPIGWVINSKEKKLQKYVNRWLKKFKQSQEMAILKDRYYAHVKIFDYVNTKVFIKRINSRLPRYKKLFKKAANKNDLPWKLLAAQSYQESQWNPRAESPTGVRGIMMLTKNTANALGVSNRLNPRASIMAGAKYLKKLEKIVPDYFNEDDKIYYSLAAYNIGMGHMKDVRILAKELGYDTTSWKGLKRALPLLSNKKYYKNLEYGYARGTEPVRYINRIQNYTDILEQKL